MATPSVDYAALAKKFGGTTVKKGAVDYTTLAKKFGGTTTPAKTAAPVTANFTANPKDEGTYTMVGKDKKALGIPYNQVRAAHQAGFRMTDPGTIKKYLADTAADPNAGRGENLPSGVRVAGRNTAGQPILAPVEAAGPQGGAFGRFVSSAGQAIGGAVSGLYHGVVEGPQNPEEAATKERVGKAGLVAKRMLIDPYEQQVQAGGKELTAAEKAKTPYQRAAHGMKAAGHTLAAALPGVGPWAAQVGEQAGTQVGTGDIAGAAGTAAGNIAVYEAPKVARGVAGAGVAGVRGIGEALTDTGPRGLKEMAKKAVEVNKSAAEQHSLQAQEAVHETAGREQTYAAKVKNANEIARQKHAEETARIREANARVVKKYADQHLQTLKKNKETLAKHEADVAKVHKENADVLRDVAKRKETQQKLDISSQELDQKIQAARTKAKAADDAAWNSWREKVGMTTAPSDDIVAQIKASRSVMDPEDVAEFSRVLKESQPTGTEAVELQATRNSLAKNQGLESYEKASPEMRATINDIIQRIGLNPDDEGAAPAKPIDALRLHVWKTQLEYAVRKATRGNVRYAIGQVLDKVRATETALSKEAGADKELAAARELHGPYKDTFVNSPNEPTTVAGTVQSKVAPEFKKESALKKQLAMLGEYDASIPQLAEHIDNLRQGLKSLPEEGPLREKLKPLPPTPELERIPAPPTVGDAREGHRLQPEPATPIPAEQTISQPERVEHPDRPKEQTLTPADIVANRKANIADLTKSLRTQGVRRTINALYYTVPGAILAKLLGRPGYAALEVAMAPVILVGSHALSNLLDRPEVVAWLSKVTPRDLAMVRSLPPEMQAVFTKNLDSLAKTATQKGLTVSKGLTAFIAGNAVANNQNLQQLRQKAQQMQQQQEAATSAKEDVQETADQLQEAADQLQQGTMTPETQQSVQQLQQYAQQLQDGSIQPTAEALQQMQQFAEQAQQDAQDAQDTQDTMVP
jgi:flagellar biosynthesis GTPase FlhF